MTNPEKGKKAFGPSAATVEELTSKLIEQNKPREFDLKDISPEENILGKEMAVRVQKAEKKIKDKSLQRGVYMKESLWQYLDELVMKKAKTVKSVQNIPSRNDILSEIIEKHMAQEKING